MLARNTSKKIATFAEFWDDAIKEGNKQKAANQSYFNITFEIDGEVADYILQNWNGKNRPITKANIEHFVKISRAHGLKAIAQSVVVGFDGHVRDGQHKLLAVQETRIPWMANVSFGATADEFPLYDTKSRKPRDSVAIEFPEIRPKHQLVAQSVALHLQINEGSLKKKFDNAEILAGLKNFPAILDTYRLGDRLGIKIGKFIPRAALVVAFARIKAACRDRKEFEAFAESLISGADLSPRSPVFRLRENLFRENRFSRDSEPEKKAAIVAAVIFAWNQLAKGKQGLSPDAFKWFKGQKFPTPDTL